jgi:hypothetical protein
VADDPGDGSGESDGRAVGTGDGPGDGDAAGAQPPTPEDVGLPGRGSGTLVVESGRLPAGGKSVAARALIAGTSGIWIEPRAS